MQFLSGSKAGATVALTAAALHKKYGSVGKAAGAVALGIEPITSDDFVWLPESFRSLVVFKQQQAILKLLAIAAGTSMERLLQEAINDRDKQQ